MNWLDRHGALALKLSEQSSRFVFYSISVVFLSVDGIKCNATMFRVENESSREMCVYPV
jgi:bacteriorhodopsin